MIKFGTDGWRAIIAKDFTFENVEKVIQAYCDILTSPPAPLLSKERVAEGRERSIILGYDRRFLSEEFAKTVASVLAANGLKVLLADSYCPTPCISWMTKRHEATAGIVVTASHNPYPWNGIKFKEGYGGSASPAFTGRIETRIVENEKSGRRPRETPFEEAVLSGAVRRFQPEKDYVQALRSQIDIKSIRSAPWKIAYDPMYGAGAGFLEKVLEAPVDGIHSEFNPGFGGLHPEPIEKNLSALIQRMKTGGLDVGLATDGDADRIGAVDETGVFVTPQEIFALLLNHLAGKGRRGDVVRSVSTTRMVDQIAALHGLNVVETPIGFKHICSKFLEVNPLIGGEESGGIAIPDHVYERDGLLSGLLLLEIMSQKKKRLRELLRDLERKIGPSHFLRDDIHLPEEGLDRLREKISNLNPAKIGDLSVVSVNKLDGSKFIFKDGSWLLIRISGTEPLCRLYAEASNPPLTRKILEEARKIVFPPVA